MGAGHDHGHSHGGNKKALFLSFLITTTYMVIEAIGGIMTNSLALLSDAGHMLSDSVSLGISLLAFTIGEKVADYGKTYGYKRFEILAALLNGATLIGIALYIFYEAFQRFKEPPEVASTGMLIIAFIGLLINLLAAWIMMRSGDTEGNINMRSAFLHVLSDLLGSVGAIVAALLIMFFSWGWADPLASVIVAVLVLLSGWRVTRDSVHVLMEGTPKGMDLDEIIKEIKSVDGVLDLHDLHVWSITSDRHALSCHIVAEQDSTLAENQTLLRGIESKLKEKGIGHTTIQVEHAQHNHNQSVMCQTYEEVHDH